MPGNGWDKRRKTIDLSEQASILFIAAGDRRHAAVGSLNVGDVLYDRGDFAGARKEFGKALTVFTKIGDGANVRSAHERIGNVLYLEGNLKEALKQYGQALSFDQETNDPAGLASDYGNIANALSDGGDLPGALKMDQSALAAFNALGNRRGAGSTLTNIGNLLVDMGRFEEARSYFEQGAALQRQTGYRDGELYSIYGLGDAAMGQGDLATARRRYDQALALAKELNEEDLGAQIHVSLAVVDLFDKRYADGQTLAAQASSVFAKSEAFDNAAAAQAILARCLLAEGNLEEARRATEEAVAFAKKVAAPAIGFEVALADARVSGEIRQLEQGANGTRGDDRIDT